MKIKTNGYREFSCGNYAIDLTVDDKPACMYVTKNRGDYEASVQEDFVKKIVNVLDATTQENNAARLLAIKFVQDNKDSFRGLTIHLEHEPKSYYFTEIIRELKV